MDCCILVGPRMPSDFRSVKRVSENEMHACLELGGMKVSTTKGSSNNCNVLEVTEGVGQDLEGIEESAYVISTMLMDGC